MSPRRVTSGIASSQTMNLNYLTISEATAGLRAKTFSSRELTEACLGKIKKHNQQINAYLTLTEDLALEQAMAVDKKISAGEYLPILAGIPCSLKDVFCQAGVRATAGSKILANYIASYDATTMAKLKKQDAVILGKVNTDEFTMGSSTETSAFGATRNPWDITRVPGGSSGGSAAAVAAGMGVYSLGTDTGGSIRQPASFCGIAGLKPTYGRISRYGVMSMASSLDTIGPLARSVKDLALILEALAGQDVNDATTASEPVINFAAKLGGSIKGLKIGVPQEYFGQGLDSEVAVIIDEAIKQFKKLGAQIVKISLPYTKYALACYYVIVPSEISANLARYDGVRYGVSAKANDLLTNYLQSRGQGLGDEVKRRIMIGTNALSAGYYDAYYLKAQQVRTLIRQDFEAAFKQVGIILTPTAPTSAFKIGAKTNDPLTMYLEDIYTVPVNLAGIPGLSVPAGLTKSGLPVGVQLLARQFNEEDLLRAGYAFEQATEWHKQHPIMD